MIVPVIATILLSIGYTQAVGLNGLCNSDTLTCTVANSYCSKQSACTYGYCVCSSGYSYNYNSGSPVCEAEKLIGDSCTSFCSVGTCTSGKCACSSTQTASSDRRSCLGKKLGETCSTVLECQGYSAYASGVRCSTTCQCAAGYQAVNDYACLWYDDGDACTSGTTVCGNLATCTSGTCQCNTVSGTKYEWYTYTTEGVTVGGCVHPSSTKNVGYGQTCTRGVYDATAKFCSSEFTCGTCPGSSSYVCLSGVGQIRASYLAMLATLVLGIKLYFF